VRAVAIGVVVRMRWEAGKRVSFFLDVVLLNVLVVGIVVVVKGSF
jgi:hypothetical protein